MQYVIDCKFIVIFFRRIIDVVHFNANLNRAIQIRGADSVERIKVSYPKFKIGVATIRDVKMKPDFGKLKTIINNVFIF